MILLHFGSVLGCGAFFSHVHCLFVMLDLDFPHLILCVVPSCSFKFHQRFGHQYHGFSRGGWWEDCLEIIVALVVFHCVYYCNGWMEHSFLASGFSFNACEWIFFGFSIRTRSSRPGCNYFIVRATLDEDPRSRDQWIQAILLVESFKLVPKLLDEGPRPKSGKLRLNLHGACNLTVKEWVV